jgi:hypothetical protein
VEVRTANSALWPHAQEGPPVDAFVGVASQRGYVYWVRVDNVTTLLDSNRENEKKNEKKRKHIKNKNKFK